jgi:hypothetical protein
VTHGDPPQWTVYVASVAMSALWVGALRLMARPLMTFVGRFVPARLVFVRRAVWFALMMSANFVVWLLTFLLMVLVLYWFGYA